MNVRTFFWRINPPFKLIAGFLFGLLVQFSHASQILNKNDSSLKMPNFVWLISEDNSKHFMRLFEAEGVETPHIKAMAAQGLLYSHAFSNSPVCSVARSTLITGTMAPRTGIQYHRKTKIAPMPDDLEMFPVYLRREGYYTTNNNKKDYNAEESSEVWDESSVNSSWRNRTNPKQPFFHQETFMESHESRLHFDEDFIQRHDTNENPQELTLFPYFPDTPTFRFTAAFHRDKIREIDAWVGKRIEELREDGLLEDTFVFYFGDHGGVLPRSKGYLYEVGLHVPLVVRVPENWRHLVPSQIPQTMEGFVSFIDFAPTLLHLAGLAIPDQMDGRPFLGRGLSMEEISGRDEAYGYADRFDEKYEMLRSVRKGKWKYIRSFQPYYPDALHNNYRYQMLAYVEWRSLFEQGNLFRETEQFFLGKPAEMLFDLNKDPHEIHNLAEDPAYLEKLKTLRNLSRQKSELILDLSFLPESIMVKEAMDNPVEYGIENKDRLLNFMEIAGLAVDQSEHATQHLVTLLSDLDELVRYWAVTTLAARKQDNEVSFKISGMVHDKSPLVRWRVIEYLGIHAHIDPFPGLIQLVNETTDPVEVLQVMNTMVFFKDHHIYDYSFDVGELKPKAINDEVSRRMAYFLGEW